MTASGRCPVCQARFRGERHCSRCGADLEPLMLLAAEAFRLRESAREALAAGEFARAQALAGQAEQTQSTPPGEALRTVSRLLGQSAE